MLTLASARSLKQLARRGIRQKLREGEQGADMAKGQRRKHSASGNKGNRTAVAVPPAPAAGRPAIERPPRSGSSRSAPVSPARRQSANAGRALPRWAIAAIAAGVVVVVAVGLYLAFGRPGSSPLVTPSLGYAVPDEGRTHVAEGSAITYQHNPPSSGSHYPSPKEWGVYDQPVAPGFFVHNLEHGGVDVLYDCPAGCPEIVTQLNDAFKNFPKDKYGEVKLVVTPYHPLPNGAKVTALAWDHEYDFTPGFDENQLLAFYNQYVDHGPEDVP
ncbi:MAG TPA: DUF3105 domain-containing protein [Chloroflexota bacterium]|nr:DUF3105 domain-containing protein [Chloroflexota bacterium]